MAELVAVLEDYLPPLRVYLEAKVVKNRVGRVNSVDPRYLIELATPKQKPEPFEPEVRTSHLSRAATAGIVARAQRSARRKLLLAPYIGAEAGALLSAGNVAYLDRAGNLHVELPAGTIIHVEGKRERKLPGAPRALRAEALRVVFALLARPELVNAPVRETAEFVGVGKTTVGDTMRDLGHRGFIVSTTGGKQLLDAPRLHELWEASYQTTLRPRLLVGEYRTPHRDPDELRTLIERSAQDAEPWAWGGATGAYLATRTFITDVITLHADGSIEGLLKTVRGARARQGNLVILRGIGPLGFTGPVPRAVHPLMIHAELMSSHDTRAHEAAEELRARYMEGDPE